MPALLITVCAATVAWLALWLLLLTLHDRGHQVPLQLLRALNFGFLVVLDDGAIVKYAGTKRQYLRLKDVARITYSFHAAVGFIAVWEFVDLMEQTLDVEHTCPGLSRLLKDLEMRLPTFSLDRWQSEFGTSGVEGTFDVWCASIDGPSSSG